MLWKINEKDNISSPFINVIYIEDIVKALYYKIPWHTLYIKYCTVNI